MEIDALRTFVEVVRRGSFAAVARDRNADPSSISRAIAGLEQQLGVRLFHRTTRQLSPTASGVAYFERVEPMIAELERAALEATDSGDTPRGTLRITAAVGFAEANLVPLLPAFAARYPEVSFDLLLTDRFLDLVEDRLDLAIRLGRLTESSLVANRLCDLVFVVAASPDYLRRYGRPQSPTELEHHQCLRYPIAGYGPVWRFRDDAGVITDVPVRGGVTATNVVSLGRCAANGMGMVLLPRWTIADYLRSGELVDVFPGVDATHSEFDAAAWLVYPSRRYLPLKVRAFADYLKRAFAHGPPAEAGVIEDAGASRRGARAPATTAAARRGSRRSRARSRS